MPRLTFPQPFHPEGRVLLGPVPASFEAFYRAELRYSVGARLSSMEVARRYATWAADHEAGSLNQRQLCRAMLNIGHSHFHSDGARFGDVQFVEADPDLADNFPGLAVDPADQGRDTMVLQIDRIAAELQKLRAKVAAA